ncbi:glycerophosphodiester phosphodiesterase [Treponema sp. TIM-1]|uniref:glycerophosphodiester phosphodiesterase n=1 Tax=Treponema sp. TIM-1 TaxID=2898417 RepID=UPI00397F97FC
MGKILNLAHRGFSGKYPENTRRAFLAAIDEGRCDGFESDVHLSADGEPVIIHDAVLGRTSTGSGTVGDHRFSALRELDIGSWKGTEFAGERILHLDELLEIVLEHHIVLNLEVKNYEVFYPGIEEKVIGRIKALGAEKAVFLSSFNHISMKKCKEIDRTIRTGLLYGYPLLDAAAYTRSHGIDAIHPRVSCLAYSPDLTRQAHEMGLAVHVWTANTEEEMAFCIEQGVDSIISNYPDKLGALLAGSQQQPFCSIVSKGG